MQGEDVFIIPHIRLAYNKGCKIYLHECYFTFDGCEPFQNYIDHFEKMKNEADSEKAKYKDLHKASKSEEHLNEIRKAEFSRSLAKLCLNSCYGRYNMKIDRSQTLITASPNDVISCFGDDSFRDVNVENLQLMAKKYIQSATRKVLMMRI